MMKHGFGAVLICSVALLAACEITVEDPPGGSGAASSSSTAGGDGGATGSSSTASGDGGATSSSSTASGDGGGGGSGGDGGAGPLACGARAGDTCSESDFCDHPDDLCGRADGEGRCSPRPDVCPADCPGVCGCDGQFYCNACHAAQKGATDVLAEGSCADAGEYAAVAQIGGIDRLTVLKAEPGTDRCVILYLQAPSRSEEGFNVELPASWGLTRAIISNRVADCALPLMSPTGEVTTVTGATGTLSFKKAADPAPGASCTLDLDVTVTAGGTDPAAVLKATGVTFDGGC